MKRIGLIGGTLAIALAALLVLTTCGRPTRHPPVPPQPPLPDSPAWSPAPSPTSSPTVRP